MELSDRMMADFESRFVLIPPDLCYPFYAEAERLTDQLLTIYRLIVLRVRDEQDIAKIASA